MTTKFRVRTAKAGKLPGRSRGKAGMPEVYFVEELSGDDWKILDQFLSRGDALRRCRQLREADRRAT